MDRLHPTWDEHPRDEHRAHPRYGRRVRRGRDRRDAGAGRPRRTGDLGGPRSIHTILGTTVPEVSARLDALYTDLQTDVESRLHRAGIPVDSSFTARLVVFVDIFGEDDPTGCRATIDVAVREFALEAGTVPRPEAPLADAHRALRAACADIEQLVRDDTSDLVDGSSPPIANRRLPPPPESLPGTPSHTGAPAKRGGMRYLLTLGAIAWLALSGALVLRGRAGRRARAVGFLSASHVLAVVAAGVHEVHRCVRNWVDTTLGRLPDVLQRTKLRRHCRSRLVMAYVRDIRATGVAQRSRGGLAHEIRDSRVRDRDCPRCRRGFRSPHREG